MSQDSVVTKRLVAWNMACEAWGFEIRSPFSAESLAGLAPGQVSFRATRMAVIGGDEVEVTLDVNEAWLPGDHPEGDHRLNDEGCHAAAVGWHAQVGTGEDAEHAERLDVGVKDDKHPRIHRHPYGSRNAVREPAEFPVPFGWLSQLNSVLGGALEDGLQNWDDFADEED